MPEGPEILYFSHYLSKHFSDDNQINDINVLSGRYLNKNINNFNILKESLPFNIVDIGTKGKFLYLKLSNGYNITFNHGMTGLWTDKINEYNRFEFKLQNKSIYFNDVRNFGIINIFDNKELEKKLNELGPDILSNEITFELFYDKISKHKHKKIGLLLMDQKIISGIGNYLRAEILWYAGISPYRIVNDLDSNLLTKLYNAAYNISRYHACTLSFKINSYFPSLNKTNLTYNLTDTPDYYNKEFYVYMQEFDIFGNPVTKEKFGERTIHWSKKIQK